MRVAITGGTGFVGGHLAASLSRQGHEAVIISRGVDQRPWAKEVQALPGVQVVGAGLDDEVALAEAFAGCDAVAHCAGINRELGDATYEAVHIRGTTNVVRAAERAQVERLVLVSFLRARPDGDSEYHESKWEAEEIVRASSLTWTVLKPGMMFGRGDHMLDHLSHTLYTFPVFLGVGACQVRPLDVADAVVVMEAALLDGRLGHATIPLLGPTQVSFDDAAREVAQVLEKRRLFVPVPLAFHQLLARLSERFMPVPLIAKAQVQILREQLIEATRAPDPVPEDLQPSTAFDAISIRAGLPAPGRFTAEDFGWRHGARAGHTGRD